MQPHLYFKSNGSALYRPLSNFYKAPVTLELVHVPTYASLLSPRIARSALPFVLEFPTSEHAWQALKADDLATFQRFLCGGAFDAFTPEVFAGLTTKREWGKETTPEQYGQKKVRYYSRNGCIMSGVVAKFAGSLDRAKRLGYCLCADREYLAADVEAAVWHELLMAKYTQNAGPRRVLLGTGQKRLVEHEKGARVYHAHWGGLVNEDGSVTGDNVMGQYLERVRGELQLANNGEDMSVDDPEVVMVDKKRKRIDLVPPVPSALAKEPETERPLKRARHMLIDDGAAQVPYEPDFFTRDEADAYFASLLSETPWTTEVMKNRYGKEEIITPRRVYAFSDPDVTYRYISLSRTGAPWTPAMLAIKERVETYCGTQFNFCFANLYRNGDDCISWHSDDEKALIPGHQIASVSLCAPGGERDFLFKHKETKERTTTRLAHGSLVVMKGDTQKRYKHTVPRRARVKAGRINLTFRQIRVDKPAA